MDLNMLNIAVAIVLGLVVVVLAYGGVTLLKRGVKFPAFICFVMAVAAGIAFFAIYGKRFFG